MTTPSTKAEPGSPRNTTLGPNLVDLELGKWLTIIQARAREINELSANRRALALADCLSSITQATREAEWRLLRICDEHEQSQENKDQETRPQRLLKSDYY